MVNLHKQFYAAVRFFLHSLKNWRTSQYDIKLYFTLQQEYWNIDDFVDNSIDTGNLYSKSDFEEIIITYYIICNSYS